MKKLLGIVVLGLLWCNVGLADKMENIIIQSMPFGADCTLKNDKNDLKVKATSEVTINFSKKKLIVSCNYPDYKTKTFKLKLRNKNKVAGFTIPSSGIINKKTELANALVCDNDVGINKASCHFLSAADLAIGLVAGTGKYLSNKTTFKNKTPETHTYANEIIKGVNYIKVSLSRY